MEWPHVFDKADVIAIVADGIATWECVKADLIALGQMEQATGSVYFNFSSFLLIRTSSKGPLPNS